MDGYYEEGEKYRNKRNYVPLVPSPVKNVPLARRIVISGVYYEGQRQNKVTAERENDLYL
jgi:hypothetical protein